MQNINKLDRLNINDLKVSSAGVLANESFVAAGVTLGIDPANDDFVALLPTLEFEGEIRIFGNRTAKVHMQDGLVVACAAYGLYVMRQYQMSADIPLEAAGHFMFY